MNWLFDQEFPISCSFAGHLQRIPPSQVPGLDIAAKLGTVVRVPASGKVLDVLWTEAGGLNVWIAHAGNVQTYYAHLQSVFVGGGQLVKEGQELGEVGATGHCTGPHLHFAVRRGRMWVDPAPVLKPKA
jgi:murein DD-endopeptidase MepM/ murein hydrolase activator NlpD